VNLFFRTGSICPPPKKKEEKFKLIGRSNMGARTAPFYKGHLRPAKKKG